MQPTEYKAAQQRVALAQMRETRAYRVPTMVKGKHTVMVVCASGWVDWPIMYADGSIAYDAPEKVPQYIRPVVAALFAECKRQTPSLV